MKKFFKRIALFFCATLLIIFGCVACTPADNRTWEEKAWDELNSIGTGVFEVGTVGGKYAYNDYSGNATKIEITVNEYENVVINILEGNAAGGTVTIGVYGWSGTSNTTGFMYFNLQGDTAKFDELILLDDIFQLEE